jgi:hypothetical protein
MVEQSYEGGRWEKAGIRRSDLEMPELFREVAAFQTAMWGRSSGFRLTLLAAPSRSVEQWHYAAVVPGYSSATATDFHRASLGPRAKKPIS